MLELILFAQVPKLSSYETLIAVNNRLTGCPIGGLDFCLTGMCQLVVLDGKSNAFVMLPATGFGKTRGTYFELHYHAAHQHWPASIYHQKMNLDFSQNNLREIWATSTLALAGKRLSQADCVHPMFVSCV